MALKTSWSIESGNIGHTFRIDQHGLYWDSYDVPETRHSGGGSQHYPHSDLSLGSALYMQLASCFGESAAKEMVYSVENMNESPELAKKRIAKEKSEEWISKIPENTSLPIPWKEPALQAFEYSGGNFSVLENLGLKLTEEKEIFSLIDIPSQKTLLQVPRFHPFNYGHVNQTRVICLYQYLYFLLPDKAVVPFENISEHWKTLDSEITLPYLNEEFIYVRFNIDRLQKDMGDYIIQLDHQGKIVGKRTLTPEDHILKVQPEEERDRRF